MKWGNVVEVETKRRIMLSVWAYAYELGDAPLVSDSVFDYAALKVNLDIETNNKNMDRWFRVHFNPFTGIWIRHHPNLQGVKKIYDDIMFEIAMG